MVNLNNIYRSKHLFPFYSLIIIFISRFCTENATSGVELARSRLILCFYFNFLFSFSFGNLDKQTNPSSVPGRTEAVVYFAAFSALTISKCRPRP